MEAFLRKSNSVSEDLLDAIPIQVWIMADEHTYGYVNAAHAAFFGKPRAKMEQQDIRSLFPAFDAEVRIAENRQVYQTKEAIISEEWATDEKGSRRLLHVVKTPKLDVAGNVLYIRCTAEDVTAWYLLGEQRTQMERQLKEYREHMEELVQDKLRELADALWGTISSLVRQTEARDNHTGGHLHRLSDSCRVVASVLSFNSVYSQQISFNFIIDLQRASLLHDIGKVGIPDSILLKPGKLTREEFEEMKKHTTIGAQTLKDAYPFYSENSVFRMAIDIALSHHERWDGKGYPAGLKGEEIPLSAQIVAICDVYDALRSTRTYKPAYSHEESLSEIRRECGTHFNPAVCDAFFHSSEEIRHIFDSFSSQ